MKNVTTIALSLVFLSTLTSCGSEPESEGSRVMIPPPSANELSGPLDLKRGDINRDGIPDFILRGGTGVGLYAMLMNSNLQTSLSDVLPIDSTIAANWVVVGVHDFDNDFYTDVLLFNNIASDRSLKVLKLGGASGRAVLSEANLMQGGSTMKLPIDLEIKGVAKLDADEDVDLILRKTDGQIIAYEMNGLSFQASHVVSAELPVNYDVKAVHETLTPQKTDLIFQHTTGAVAADVVRWRLDKFTKIQVESPTILAVETNAALGFAPPWQFMAARRFVGDVEPSLIAVNANTGQMRRYMFEDKYYVGLESLSFVLGTAWDLASD